MLKKEVPLFIVLIFFLTIGVLVIKKETDTVAMNRYRDLAAVAARNAPSISYQKINNSPKETQALSAFVKQNEKGVSYNFKTIHGTLEIIHHDSQDQKEVPSDLYTPFLVSSEGVYKIQNISDNPLIQNLNGINLELTGLVSTSDISKQKSVLVNFNQTDVKNLRPKKIVTRNLATSSLREAACPGNYCALVIPLDTTGAGALPSPTEIQDYIFNGRIKSVLAEESYGAMTYAGVVTDWIHISDPNPNIFNAPPEVSDYLQAHNINPNSYNQIVFLVNGGPESSGGLGSIGVTPFWIGGSFYSIPVAIVGFSTYSNRADLLMANGNLSYFDHLYVHETGHNLGAVHDNLLNCKSGPVSAPSECIFTEYGNNYSVMGGGALGAHFSFLNKMRIGWINQSNIFEMTSGMHALNPIESSNPTFLGLDYGNNGVPDYLFERRSSVGFDTKNLFSELNYDGEFVYRLTPDFGLNSIPADPTYWTLNLVDTTPASRPSGWPMALKDAVLKIPQSFMDTGRVKGFRQNSSGGNNLVEIYNGLAISNPCSIKPIKVFEPAGVSDLFPGQVGQQNWGTGLAVPNQQNSPNPTGVSVDLNDPNAQIMVYKSLMIFNDDSLQCPASNYTFKMKFNGVELPLLSDSSAQYPSWGGPYYQTVFAVLPNTGLSYGPTNVTLEVTKQNNATVFSKNLVFQLEP